MMKTGKKSTDNMSLDLPIIKLDDIGDIMFSIGMPTETGQQEDSSNLIESQQLAISNLSGRQSLDTSSLASYFPLTSISQPESPLFVASSLVGVFKPGDNNYNSWTSPRPSSSPAPSSVESSPTPSPMSMNVSSAECVVCRDKSSGKHYGVFSCEGCKSFFKRSIRRNLKYSCRFNNSCKIDKNHRNQCQRCRLAKCFKVGMKKEAVQRGRQKTVGSEISEESEHMSSTIISQLIDAEPITRNSERTQTVNIEDFGDTATTLLFNVIQWAKNIPFFQQLHPDDQQSLIKLSWKELFVINFSKAELPLKVTDLVQTNTIGWPQYGGTFCEHVKSLQNQIDTLKGLHMDPTEFACMKALILFSSDSPCLMNSLSIQMIQEKILTIFQAHIKTKYPIQFQRFGKLMLRISSLRTINPVLISQLFFSSTFNRFTIDSAIQLMTMVGGIYTDNGFKSTDNAMNNSCPDYTIL